MGLSVSKCRAGLRWLHLEGILGDKIISGIDSKTQL